MYLFLQHLVVFMCLADILLELHRALLGVLHIALEACIQTLHLSTGCITLFCQLHTQEEESSLCHLQ